MKRTTTRPSSFVNKSESEQLPDCDAISSDSPKKRTDVGQSENKFNFDLPIHSNRLTANNRKEGWEKYLTRDDRLCLEVLLMEVIEFDEQCAHLEEEFRKICSPTQSTIDSHSLDTYNTMWSDMKASNLIRREQLITVQERIMAKLYSEMCQNFPLAITRHESNSLDPPETTYDQSKEQSYGEVVKESSNTLPNAQHVTSHEECPNVNICLTRKRLKSQSSEGCHTCDTSPMPVDIKLSYTEASFFTTPRKVTDGSDCLLIDDLLKSPSRSYRPKRIVFLLYGLPGSGKSVLARRIKEHEEAANGQPNVRLLSLEDYTFVKKEKILGSTHSSVIVYDYETVPEYNSQKETYYKLKLFSAFQQTLRNGLFEIAILGTANASDVKHYHACAIENHYIPYLIEMQTIVSRQLNQKHGVEGEVLDEEIVDYCFKRNKDSRSFADIRTLHGQWQHLPAEYLRVDAFSLFDKATIGTKAHESPQNVDGHSGGHSIANTTFKRARNDSAITQLDTLISVEQVSEQKTQLSQPPSEPEPSQECPLIFRFY